MFAVWLPPTVTVPETYHDEEPFVLSARELRGVVSNGMLASAKELALGDNHEGILEIDVEAHPGQPFAEVYHLDDHIIDIENKMFTHRPDCFGQLGVARELAGIQHMPFASPSWYRQEPAEMSGKGLHLDVHNDIKDVVPRFMAAALKNVSVHASPMWLQTALLRLGSRPINNVVDITNYLMLVTGQPLHAYDYDKVAKGKLAARFGKDGEKVALLNGKDHDQHHRRSCDIQYVHDP
jgi:phenylalanyl-tRNA synthetase beta chain